MPASPNPVRVSQPDGSPITVRVRGDEFFHWYEDTAGFSAMRVDGEYVYANLNDLDELVPTSLLVGRADPEAMGIPVHARPSKRQLTDARAAKAPPAMAQVAAPELVPPTGTVRNLVVLCMFSDHTSGVHGRAEADYDVLFNTIGGDAVLAPTGSVKDVYLENSYGVMTLESTVAVWVTLPQTEAFYAASDDGTGNYPRNAQGMLEDALDLLDPLLDFGPFDTDNDGYIDSISVIHSGYGAETGGGGGNWIWSHRWSLWALPGGQWTSGDLNGNGENVKVYDYHTEPALWGTSGANILRIGVICHETGHFFGLPDLYDTNGGGSGIGSYGMMANSWGFDGTQLHPPHFSAWSKISLGWITPTVITVPGIYTAPQVETTPTVFQINSGYPSGEYLLIENRQPVGVESAMPQGGLAIWHIDNPRGNNRNEGYPGQPGWPENNNHYMVALLQADGDYDLEHGSNRGDGGDVYHGGGVDFIDPTTAPNTNAYQGGTVIVTDNTISEISASGASMTFRFGFGDDLGITPKTVTSFRGPEGGPFTPASADYTLTNNGLSAIDWNASWTADWLDVAPSSGSLLSGGSVAVTVAPNPSATTQFPGWRFDTLTFTNETSAATIPRAVSLRVDGIAALPFMESFETGGPLMTYWEVTGANEYRTQVTTADAPHGGAYHLTMDDSVNGGNYSRNELTLAIDLAGQTGVILSFWAKDFSDESHGPPAIPFTNNANFDGVAISEDGVTWYEVQDLRGSINSSYQQLTVNLDTAIAFFGLAYNSSFYLRFNQYDNYSITTDGIALDDISITAATTPVVVSVDSPHADGVFAKGEAIEVQVLFSEAVQVTGAPTLELETGVSDRLTSYTGGSGTDTLSFLYTVQAGDDSADLDYTQSLALNLNGGAIRDAATNTISADISLPAPGTAGSLGANKAIVIDTVAPVVTVDPISTNDATPELTGSVTDNWGVSGVEVTVDGNSYAATVAGSSWSLPDDAITPDLSDGIHSVLALATDDAGTTSADLTSNELLIDTQGPDAPAAPADDGQYTNNTSLSFTWAAPSDQGGSGIASYDYELATDSGFVSVVASGNRTATNVSYTGSSGNSYYCRVRAIDNVGNPGSFSMGSDGILLDTQSPAVTVDILNIADATPQLTGTATDAGGSGVASVTAWVNGETYSAVVIGSIWTADVTNALADGAYNVFATVTDRAGNNALDSSLFELTIDTSPVGVSLSSGETANGGYVNDSVISFTASFSEAVTGFNVSEINVTNGAAGSFVGGDGNAVYTFDVTASSQGAVSVQVPAAAAASVSTIGKLNAASTPAPFTFTFDNIAPMEGAADSPAYENGSTISVSYSGASDELSGLQNVELWYKYTAGGAWTDSGLTEAGASGAFNFTPIGGDGAYYFDLVAVDNSGNRSAAAQGAGDSVTNYDTAAPSVEEISPTPGSALFSITSLAITFDETIVDIDAADLQINGFPSSGVFHLDQACTFTFVSPADGLMEAVLAAGSFTDLAGNEFGGATFSYTVDTSPLVVSLSASTPHDGFTSSSLVDFTATFTEAVSGFDATDLQLTGGAVGAWAGAADTFTFTVTPDQEGLLSVEIPAGVAASTVIIGKQNAASDVYRWTYDITSPTVEIAPVNPNPTMAPLEELSIVFSEVVLNFEATDLALTLDDAPVSLTSATLSSSDGQHWTLGGLETMTVDNGAYELIVSSADIVDQAGNPLETGAFRSWWKSTPRTAARYWQFYK